MSELVRNPRMKSKSQDEIRDCIGKKGRVTEVDIEQLYFLKMIIKETLRLHLSGPLLLPREAISHFEVDGYYIYPKTIIQVNAWAISRDPNYLKKPDEFCPERLMDNSIHFKGQNFEYIPSGSGRRSCPGVHVEMKTVELALTNLFYHFDWKLPDGMRVEESDGLSLAVSKKTAPNLVPIRASELITAYKYQS